MSERYNMMINMPTVKKHISGLNALLLRIYRLLITRSDLTKVRKE